MRARYLLVVLGMIIAGVITAGVAKPALRAPSVPLEGPPLNPPTVHALTGSQRRVLGSSGCLVCHGDPHVTTSLPGTSNEALYIQTDVLDGSAHASLTCLDCHRALEANVHTDPAGDLAWAVGSCERCHTSEARAMETSIHGSRGPLPDEEKLLGAELPSQTPTCLTCHGGHDVPIARSRTFVAAVARTCSGCHVERGESYFERNYHGKESALGRVDVASCPDCHGAHAILPRSDPSSTVNPANVLETCRRCHIQAGGNFGDVVIHVQGRPLPTEPKLRTITVAMILLIVGTFAAFGVHTALAIRHAWRRRRVATGAEEVLG